MAIALRDSFIDVHLEEAELTQHVLDVIKARPTGPERRAAIAYLRQIVHRDADDIAHFRYINARARQVLEDREKLHTAPSTPTYSCRPSGLTTRPCSQWQTPRSSQTGRH